MPRVLIRQRARELLIISEKKVFLNQANVNMLKLNQGEVLFGVFMKKKTLSFQG